MKDLKIIFGSIAIIVIIISCTWLITAHDVAFKSFFNPMYEEVNRKTFESSKEYTHGTIQELYKIQAEYAGTSDADFKKALASRAKFMVSSFDKELLPPELLMWINSL